MKPPALLKRLRAILPLSASRRGVAASFPGWAPVAALLLALAVVSILVVPTLSTDGDTTDVQIEQLGTGNTPISAVTGGTVSSSADGYLIDGQSGGLASISLQFFTKRGQRSILRLWAYGGPSLETEASIVGPGGRSKELGRAGVWVGKAFDVTDVVRNGRARIYVETSNESAEPALFFDQAAATVGPENSVADSSTPLVALWVALIVAGALQIRRQLARHWFLAGAAAVLVLVVWSEVVDGTSTPLDGGAAGLWEAARSAETLSLHSGLITGSFGGISALAAQTYHVLTAVVGDGDAGARAASVLMAVGALCALYALGNRAAGRIGATTVLILALLADPFREAATSGTAVPVLILAAAVFAYGIHVCLAEASRYAVGILGACGALAFLADATWLFGILVAIPILAFRYGRPGERWRAAGVGTLVLLVLILPNRVSTADQSAGNLFSDMTERATAARSAELGEASREVGLVPYLLDEHSAIVFVGGSLSGANEALGDYGHRDETRLAGLIAFALGILGSAYLLMAPRLRMLILLPLCLALPSLFFASKNATTPFAAGTAVWPSFLVGGGVLVFVIRKLVADRRAERAPAFDRPPRSAEPTTAGRTAEPIETG